MAIEIEKILTNRAIGILMALEDGPQGVRELAKKTGGSFTTIVYRLRDLERLGLVKREKSKHFPFKHTITLTEKGRIILVHLKEIMRILSGE